MLSRLDGIRLFIGALLGELSSTSRFDLESRPADARCRT
jgi:hypothetical protein